MKACHSKSGISLPKAGILSITLPLLPACSSLRQATAAEATRLYAQRPALLCRAQRVKGVVQPCPTKDDSERALVEESDAVTWLRQDAVQLQPGQPQLCRLPQSVVSKPADMHCAAKAEQPTKGSASASWYPSTIEERQQQSGRQHQTQRQLQKHAPTKQFLQPGVKQHWRGSGYDDAAAVAPVPSHRQVPTAVQLAMLRAEEAAQEQEAEQVAHQQQHGLQDQELPSANEKSQHPESLPLAPRPLNEAAEWPAKLEDTPESMALSALLQDWCSTTTAPQQTLSPSPSIPTDQNAPLLDESSAPMPVGTSVPLPALTKTRQRQRLQSSDSTLHAKQHDARLACNDSSDVPSSTRSPHYSRRAAAEPSATLTTVNTHDNAHPESLLLDDKESFVLQPREIPDDGTGAPLHTDMQRMYVSSWLPGGYAGALELTALAGVGWMAVSTVTARPGDVLMIAEPLAVVAAPVTGGPPPRARTLLRQLALEQRQRMDMLRQHQQQAGSSSVAAAATAAVQQRALMLQWHGVPSGRPLQPPLRMSDLASLSSSVQSDGDKVAAAVWARRQSSSDAKRMEAGVAGAGAGPGDLAPVDMQQLQRIVELNAYGDVRQDAAAMVCRGEAAGGHLGLWPAFSMLNHSCAPSAVHLIVGNRMVVRASQVIAPGEEVTINYLGRSVLAPLAFRQQDLQDRYGFDCKCRRCVAEGHAGRLLGFSFGKVLTAADQLSSGLDNALESRDLVQLGEVSQAAADLLDQVASMCEEASLSSYERDAVGAALYDLHEVRALALEALSIALAAGTVGHHSSATGQTSDRGADMPSTTGQAHVGTNVKSPGCTSAPAAGSASPLQLRAKTAQKAQPACPPGARTQAASQQRRYGSAATATPQRPLTAAVAAAAADSAAAQCLAVVGSVVPGCDLHTLGAAKLVARLQDRRGAKARAAWQEAMQSCQQAHLLRYGPLDVMTQQLLILASAQCAAELDGA